MTASFWVTALRPLAFILCVFLPGQSAAGEVLVDWDETRIRLGKLESPIDDAAIRGPITEQRLQKYPVVDCMFELQKTKCYKVGSPRPDDAYGVNLKFVKPKPRMPVYYTEAPDGILGDDLSSGQSDYEEPPNWFSYEVVQRLPPYKFQAYTPNQEAGILDTHDYRFSTEDNAYSLVENVENGSDVLDMWRRLVHQRPKRTCLYGEIYCSVVLTAEKDGRPALVHCSILNGPQGLGLPFNCDFVAFEGRAGWYIDSFSGPELLDGGGAGGDATCIVPTLRTPEQIAGELIQAIKDSIIDLDLKIDPLASDEARLRKVGAVRISGKAVGKLSKFYSGYFENSLAYYNLIPVGDQEIFISGSYIVLVGADPSPNKTFYRDLDSDTDFDLEWLKLKIDEVFTKGLANRLGVEVSCN